MEEVKRKLLKHIREMREAVEQEAPVEYEEGYIAATLEFEEIVEQELQ